MSKHPKKKLARLLLGLSVVLGFSHGVDAQTAFDSTQASQSNGNVPAGVEFQHFLMRDLKAYFVSHGFVDAAVSYDLLRHGATQSGVSYPKYYLWVQGMSKRGAIAGAVRVEAIDKTHFEVTDFIRKSVILAHPDDVGTVFPASLVELIQRRATRP